MSGGASSIRLGVSANYECEYSPNLSHCRTVWLFVPGCPDPASDEWQVKGPPPGCSGSPPAAGVANVLFAIEP